jgi:hypothetical protein
MYASFGLGRDTDVIGSYSAFGFGILTLFPEGIITIVADIVYNEVRLCIIE